MKTFPVEACFNCERSAAEAPISNWQYKGQEFWVCSQCMPLLIHKLEQVLADWEAEAEED